MQSYRVNNYTEPPGGGRTALIASGRTLVYLLKTHGSLFRENSSFLFIFHVFVTKISLRTHAKYIGNGGQIQRDLAGIWWILLQKPTFVTKIDLTSCPGGVRRCSWALEHRIFASLSISDGFGSIATVLPLENRRNI